MDIPAKKRFIHVKFYTFFIGQEKAAAFLRQPHLHSYDFLRLNRKYIPANNTHEANDTICPLLSPRNK